MEPGAPWSSPHGPASSGPSELHPGQVEDEVLESVLQGRLVHPEVVRALRPSSVRGRWGASGDPDPLTGALPHPDGTPETPALAHSSQSSQAVTQQAGQDGL